MRVTGVPPKRRNRGREHTGTHPEALLVAEAKPKLNVSVVQVAGSALAAVTAAVVASSFGVAGTVIGAAVVSAVATAATSIYTSSLRRANDRLLTLQVLQGRVRRRPGPADIAVGGATGEKPTAATAVVVPAAEPPADHRVPAIEARPRRGALLVATVAAFLLAMAVVTGVELVAGHPLSSLFGGEHARKGTSVGDVFGGGRAPVHRPSPVPTPAQHPSPTGRPSPSPSPTPTPTPAASATPSGSPKASPPTPSPSPRRQLSSPR